MLNMSILDIRREMNFNYDVYENILETNCYAYALGLDIPETKICKYAYDLGIIASHIFNIPYAKIKKLTNEERMLLDFKALKLGYKESFEQEPMKYIFKGNYYCILWDILLFTDYTDNDFHVARVDFDGELHHKLGRHITEPKITCIDDIEKLGYTYERRYRLSLWKSYK